MDRPPHQYTDPFAKPDRDLARAKADLWSDPWNVGESPEGEEAEAVPKSTQDFRDVYLRQRNEVASSAGVSVLNTSRLLTIASGVWARVQSRFPLDRRVVAGLGLFGVACALLFGLSRSDLAPSIRTVSNATYNTAVAGLASAVNGARDLVGKSPVAPPVTEEVASIARKKAPSVRPATAKRGPLDSSRALPLLPLLSTETVQANGPALIDNADVAATTAAPMERASKEALALPPADAVVETTIIYSPNDVDVSPPVAIRVPGIATDVDLGNNNVTLIEILVSETGRVDSTKVRRRPATLGAALQSAAALSVVKTWRFWPARKNGQPVKYRTTVPVETVYPAGMTDGSR